MSQPGSDQNKKRSRSLEYCNQCQDRLISGINNEGLVSKLQNMDRRDKTTTGMVSFKTMLQVAKTVWQLEKVYSIIQGLFNYSASLSPQEQVNYTNTTTPQSQSKNEVKINLSASARLTPVNIGQVCTPLPCMPSFTEVML